MSKDTATQNIINLTVDALELSPNRSSKGNRTIIHGDTVMYFNEEFIEKLQAKGISSVDVNLDMRQEMDDPDGQYTDTGLTYGLNLASAVTKMHYLSADDLIAKQERESLVKLTEKVSEQKVLQDNAALLKKYSIDASSLNF